VTDKSEAKELAGSLRMNLSSPMSYSNLVKAGLPQEVLNDDEETAGFKLNIKSVKIVDSKDTFR
ncbi:MAG: hypothetical protein O6940_00065, partial [Ignavibacteria bacterium]|nr:hypothetical protein [Ignavibacteria bacterium]